jgi:multiple sugar transport system substrate-binding protein
MMGSEPDFPAWAEMSNNVIPVELGKFLAGQTKSGEECMANIQRQVDEMAAPYRKA